MNNNDDDNRLSDDDNAQTDDVAAEDPLWLAVDDLEGRVIGALEDVKVSTAAAAEELAVLFRPVLEVAAHTGPSIARTYYRGLDTGVDVALDRVYERTVSDLVLPVVLELAQSAPSPRIRAAVLEFLRTLWNEWHKPGSWLEIPYGNSSGTLPRPLLKRRRDKKLARQGELLRYWVQASIACVQPGVFTDTADDEATLIRGILAASASWRPCLRHLVLKIQDADDRGATRLYNPLMKLLAGVVRALLDGRGVPAALVFVEVVALTGARKPEETKRRKAEATSDFSLDDLPEGHPVITREALGRIGDYAFAILRGMLFLGGQVPMDQSMMDMLAAENAKSPSAQVVNLLQPAALAYLEIESNFPALPSGGDTDLATVLDVEVDRSSIELSVVLNPKAYTIAINAVSALALNRPSFFAPAALCLARRAVQPPLESSGIPPTASRALAAHLRATCLTFLRSMQSVTSNSCDVLHLALVRLDMKVQADSALASAKKAVSLTKGSRSEQNKAKTYYTWEASETATDDALAKLRSVKAARGLGNGIQLPASMSDAIDLILVNLSHLPVKRPTGKSKVRSVPVSLEFVVDAVLTNGTSLKDEGPGHWYKHSGGVSWTYQDENGYTMDPEIPVSEDKLDDSEPVQKKRKLFLDQCENAAADCVDRIVNNTSVSRSKALEKFSAAVSARLAFTLSKVKPVSPNQVSAFDEAKVATKDSETGSMFVDEHPLATCGLAAPAVAVVDPEASASSRLLGEALLLSNGGPELYDRALDLYIASVVHASDRANAKPIDNDLKATAESAMLQCVKVYPTLPRLTEQSLRTLARLCDIEAISTKKATTQESVAVSAATHAAKAAAEKRATACLLLLRDVAFYYDAGHIRKAAVDVATRIASGRMPSSLPIQEKALKLVMNVLYGKNDAITSLVTQASDAILEEASNEAQTLNPPPVEGSDDEKKATEKMRKAVFFYMALCFRDNDRIPQLLRVCSTEGATLLDKACRICVPKLAKAVAAKIGAAQVATDVAASLGTNEVPLLLSFIENLSNAPDDELVEACFKIQEDKSADGTKDPRFIIPILSGMKRSALVENLPAFVAAEDDVLTTALAKMSARLGRQALIYREDNDMLLGMTLCEQLVYLHEMDFAVVSITQKRYLMAIKLCLDLEETYTDNVWMSALDQISGSFLTEKKKLPLAFMRSCILVCSKHESLHSWIANVLLPRLVEGEIWQDARQFEGFLRCAHMLEGTTKAIEMLPPEQLFIYKSKWAGK